MTKIKCTHCGGTGYHGKTKCPVCKGTGYIMTKKRTGGKRKKKAKTINSTLILNPDTWRGYF